MKAQLFILVFNFFLFSCQGQQVQIENIWVHKYSVEHDSTILNPRIREYFNQILVFNEDSIFVKKFPVDWFLEDSEPFKLKYLLANNHLIVVGEEIIDTLLIRELSEDSLKISFASSLLKTNVYQKLPKFNQAKNKDAFLKFLTENTFNFWMGDMKIEFLEDGRFITSDLDYHLGNNQFWILDEFEGELFLILDDFFGIVIHIQSFDESGFKGIRYKKENLELDFKKVEEEPEFALKNLIGVWEEYQPEDLPPPPLFESNEDFHQKELLNISDSIIFRCYLNQKDTLNWISNRGQNQLIFREYSRDYRNRQWKIIKLNEEELIIERCLKRPINIDEPLERKRFIKK